MLRVVSDGEWAAKGIMNELKLKHRPTFFYEYLQPALTAGLLEMTQPDSPKSPTQKYRLTAQGRAFLAE